MDCVGQPDHTLTGFTYVTGDSLKSVAAELGINRNTLKTWVVRFSSNPRAANSNATTLDWARYTTSCGGPRRISRKRRTDESLDGSLTTPVPTRTVTGPRTRAMDRNCAAHTTGPLAQAYDPDDTEDPPG